MPRPSILKSPLELREQNRDSSVPTEPLSMEEWERTQKLREGATFRHTGSFDGQTGELAPYRPPDSSLPPEHPVRQRKGDIGDVGRDPPKATDDGRKPYVLKGR
jgi:hypothetical protein